MHKIYISLLLLFYSAAWADTCPVHTPEQRELIELAYTEGQPHDLGYTLASIVIQESFVGSYVVRLNPKDGKHGSYGLTHINLSTAMWLEGYTNSWQAKQDLVPRLMVDDVFSLQLSISKLKLSEGLPWRVRWAKYNGSGPKAVEYSQKIARLVIMLKTCYNLEKPKYQEMLLMQSQLKDHMTPHQRTELGKLPTTHENCLERCGAARPGKTAKDKANGHIPYVKNRRMWDSKERKWYKA